MPANNEWVQGPCTLSPGVWVYEHAGDWVYSIVIREPTLMDCTGGRYLRLCDIPIPPPPLANWNPDEEPNANP